MTVSLNLLSNLFARLPYLSFPCCMNHFLHLPWFTKFCSYNFVEDKNYVVLYRVMFSFYHVMFSVITWCSPLSRDVLLYHSMFSTIAWCSLLSLNVLLYHVMFSFYHAMFSAITWCSLSRGVLQRHIIFFLYGSKYFAPKRPASKESN